MPQKLNDIISYDNTILKKERRKSLQDSADYFYLLYFNDENFNLQKNKLDNMRLNSFTKENLDTFSAKFSSFYQNEIFLDLSAGNFVSNYYFEDKDNFIVFFILKDNSIAIFMY